MEVIFALLVMVGLFVFLRVLYRKAEAEVEERREAEKLYKDDLIGTLKAIDDKIFRIIEPEAYRDNIDSSEIDPDEEALNKAEKAFYNL